MKKIIFLIILISLNAFAEFQQTSTRYISGYDFQNKYMSFFKNIYEDGTKPESNYGLRSTCFETLPAFGANNPATGRPSSQNPTAATVNVIQKCLASTFSLLSALPSQKTLAEVKNYLAPLIDVSILDKQLTEQTYKNWINATSMSQLPIEDQKMIIKNLVENFLGTDDVISSYGIIKDVEAFRDYLFKKNQYSTVYAALYTTVNLLVLRDEFLTY